MIQYRFAVISDIHVAAFKKANLSDFMNQRIIGLANWVARRRHHFPPVIREALFADLIAQKDISAIEGLIVCGDLTTLALPEEFEVARKHIAALDLPASQLLVIPGNHDSYTRGAHRKKLFHNAFGHESPLTEIDYPLDIETAHWALLGLSTAFPSRPLYATGKLGGDQLSHLEARLQYYKNAHKPVIIVMHHPPQLPKKLAHKSLLDSVAFQSSISKEPPALIIHGHLHQRITSTLSIQTSMGPRSIPVRGLPASCYNSAETKRWPAYPTIDLDRPGEISITWRKYDFNTKKYSPDISSFETISIME